MQKEFEPVVSVVMPAYNCRSYIRQAVESVMGQTFSDWELLIINDCATDDTLAVARELAAGDPRIRVLSNEKNLGVSKTRNRGIAEAKGKYIAYLDSDDVWLPEKLEKQLALMERTGATLCYCSYAIIDKDGNPSKADYISPETVTYEELLRENVIQCSSIVLPAEVARKYPFTSEFYHEDYVLSLSVLRDGYTAAGCTQVLSQYRHIEGSRSANKVQAAKNRWIIYRDHLHLPLGKRIGVFLSYVTAGLRKYTSKPKGQ